MPSFVLRIGVQYKRLQKFQTRDRSLSLKLYIILNILDWANLRCCLSSVISVEAKSGKLSLGRGSLLLVQIWFSENCLYPNVESAIAY